MYLKINLSSQLITNLSDRIDMANFFVRETESQRLQYKGKMQFAYDVYCHTNEMSFGVLMNFLSHGAVFAYCSCGLPGNERCLHIEKALVFHQERSRYELEKLFGEEVVIGEGVF